MAKPTALSRRLRSIGFAAVCITIPGGMNTASAAPVEMPNRKPGLWEIKVNAGPQMPAMTMQQCTDVTTDKDMATTFSPMAKEVCSKQDMQKTATGMVIDSVCNVSGMNSASRTEINGDFNSAYTVKVNSKTTGGPASVPAESSTTMEAKWVGACKADQKPGDIIMPGGMKINIKDMQALKGMAPKK